MKRFIKKINRGVILSLVLLICIGIYYIVIDAKTTKVIAELTPLTNDFLVDYSTYSVYSGDDIIASEQLDDYVENLRPVFSKYFFSDGGCSEFLEQLKQILVSQTYKKSVKVHISTNTFSKFDKMSIDFSKKTGETYLYVDYRKTSESLSVDFTTNNEKYTNNGLTKYTKNCYMTFAKNDSGEWLIKSYTESGNDYAGGASK